MAIFYIFGRKELKSSLIVSGTQTDRQTDMGMAEQTCIGVRTPNQCPNSEVQIDANEVWSQLVGWILSARFGWALRNDLFFWIRGTHINREERAIALPMLIAQQFVAIYVFSPCVGREEGWRVSERDKYRRDQRILSNAICNEQSTLAISRCSAPTKCVNTELLKTEYTGTRTRTHTSAHIPSTKRVFGVHLSFHSTAQFDSIFFFFDFLFVLFTSLKTLRPLLLCICSVRALCVHTVAAL